MTKNLKISRFFLLASVATTFIKIPSYHEYLRIGDLFLFISFIFIIIAIVKKQINLKNNKELIKIVLFWIGVNVLGSILSFIIYKNLPLQYIILNYARLASCLIIFSEIILLSEQDKLMIKKSIFCLLGSLIIIPMSFIFQKFGSQYLMFDPSRFSGLLIDPNYFANFQIIPTVLLIFFIMKGNIKPINKIILYIGFVLSISMILWSGSRSGILGLFVSILIILFFFVKFLKTTKTKVIVIILLIIVAFPLGYMFIPKNRHIPEKTEIKTLQIVTNSGIVTKTQIVKIPKTKVDQKSRLETFSNVSDVVLSNASNDRLAIWKESIYYIISNPLGYGPGYNQIINIHGDGGENRVVHNFEIEMLLQGGILLFIFFNYFFLMLLINTYKNPSFKIFNEIHVFVAIIIGILTSSLFLDSIPQKWIWVIVALIIVYNRQLVENKITE